MLYIVVVDKPVISAASFTVKVTLSILSFVILITSVSRFDFVLCIVHTISIFPLYSSSVTIAIGELYIVLTMWAE